MKLRSRLTAGLLAAGILLSYPAGLPVSPDIMQVFAAETAVYAAENADCTVDISHAEAAAGEKVSVSISVNSTVGIGGLRLTYDPALQPDKDTGKIEVGSTAAVPYNDSAYTIGWGFWGTVREFSFTIDFYVSSTAVPGDYYPIKVTPIASDGKTKYELNDVSGGVKVYGNARCGENLTWMLDSEGTLTISGTGKMWNWTGSSSVPWYHCQKKIGVLKYSQ